MINDASPLLCRACLASSLAHCLTVRDRHMTPPRDTEILACPRCGTGRTGAVTDETEVRHLNDALYAMDTSYAHRIHDEQHRRRCLDDAIWISRRIPPPPSHGTRPRHLDIGCSGGGMMHAFGELGYDSFGIEPSAAVDNAPPEIASRIQRCYFGEETFSDPFQLITAFHVLEHVTDPETFLSRCRHRLTARGMLVIEVPDFDCARRRLQQDPDALLFHISPYYHIHHFTLAGLKAILGRTGFTTVWGGRVAPLVLRKSFPHMTAACCNENVPCGASDRLATRVANPLRRMKDLAWKFRPVRVHVRHALAHSLGLGQHIRVIARL